MTKGELIQKYEKQLLDVKNVRKWDGEAGDHSFYMEYDAQKLCIEEFIEDLMSIEPSFTPYTEETTLTGVYEVKTNKGRTIKVEFEQGMPFSLADRIQEGEEVISYRKT